MTSTSSPNAATNGTDSNSTVAGKDETLIAVREGAIDVETVARSVEAALKGGAGAIVSFAGVVRNNSQGHDDIEYLEYQAYAPMAEREMRVIADEVQLRWNAPCAMIHRVGRLEVGEASIVIAVAAPHRGEAFEACRYAIDRVKETVPVWKKEVARDGFWWVEDPLSGVAAASLSSTLPPPTSADGENGD